MLRVTGTGTGTGTERLGFGVFEFEVVVLGRDWGGLVLVDVMKV
jgi:hypothetical protein